MLALYNVSLGEKKKPRSEKEVREIQYVMPKLRAIANYFANVLGFRVIYVMYIESR